MQEPDTSTQAASATGAHACIPDRFREEAQRRPDAVALECDGRRWTYRELDSQSDQVATRLRGAGITPGGRVGLFLRRSPEWILSALATLKAGGVYVPLLPDWPERRLRELASASGIAVVTGASPNRPAWLDSAIPYLETASVETAPLQLSPGTVAITPEDPAYILFTSGSTGRPKGVLVPHRAVCRLAQGQQYVPFGPSLRCLHLSSPAFDATTFEVWGPLLSGGTCIVHSPQTPDLDLLERDLKASRANCVFLTTGLFNQVVDLRPQALAGICHLLTGGERLSESHARRALDLLPSTQLVHCYGPTEATTFETTGVIAPPGEWIEGRSVPIGRELAGTRGEVVDAAGNTLPDGEPGELVIGGDGIALGYLNDPELTAARFLPDPSDPTGKARRYRTGDRVRRLPDGQFEFLGRMDSQVKIRGHRIEPGDVESALRSHPSVRAAIVVDRPAPGGMRELVACIQCHEATAMDVSDLRNHLSERLPDFMIPAAFRVVDTWPLNAAGKVDRESLATGADAVRTGNGAHDEPRTPLEEILCREWAAVLGRPRVGIHDSFFDLGGQSLLALRLMARLRPALGRPVRLVDLFQQPTVAGLAALLDPASRPSALPSGIFKGRSTGVPWFHVPGVFGLEVLPPSIAEVVGRHRPYFDQLQFPGTDGRQPPLRDASAIAAALAGQIEEKYPEGPLCLSGFSFGGEVACELALHLGGRGRAVERVVLFDTCLKSGVRRRTPAARLQFLRGRIHAQPAGDRLAFVAAVIRTKFREKSRRWLGPQTAASKIRRRVERASVEAHATFRPRPCATPVCLIRGGLPSRHETGAWEKAPDNGWAAAHHPQFEVRQVACDHERVFIEPVSPEVLAVLEDLLSPSASTGGTG